MIKISILQYILGSILLICGGMQLVISIMNLLTTRKQKRRNREIEKMTRDEAIEILNTIPTIGEQVDALEMAIEALERRHGHWAKRTTVTSNGNTYYSYECSECGDHHGTMWKYCPYCGADMRGSND